MQRAKRARFHPLSLHNPQAEKLIFVSLEPDHTEIEGTGLHLQSPETYWTWVEEMQERAYTEGDDYYWD